MPTYEMKCPGCDREWEVRCKYEELQLLVNSLCRNCSQPAVQKMSKTTFRLNGSGFYNTDYKGIRGPKR